jgi:hypothetical protein
LALIGWIPGPGDGVKKSLRIVNRNPDRFAPVLYDLLRFVLNECGIKTSPEALLEETFNASALKARIDDIRQGVEDASAFQSLPESMQTVVRNSMVMASTNMPVLVGVVEKRLKKWRGKQRNSSAKELPKGPAKQQPPKAEHSDTAKSGKDGNTPGHANTSVNAQIATQSLEGLTNEMLGISGEHIADYWAFEAGAVALLCEIDDSQISHMVYPKDLVAWAKAHANDYPNGSASDKNGRSNVPADQPCPEAGWWFTPAQANSRRYFKQGETMPSVGGDYGDTFWQWSPDQSVPKL